MRMSVAWGVVPALVVVIAGAALIARPALATGVAGALRRRSTWGARLTTARAELKRTLGPAGAWVMLCGAGVAVSVAVLWPLGRVALRIEGAWDHPVFAWFRDHQAGSGWLRLNEILTEMGNRPKIYAVACASVLVLVFFAPRRRWAPPALAVMAVLVEQFVRVGLSRTVHRGHPPTSLGTWPSGGVGRIIAIYGFIVFLMFWCARRRGLRIATRRTAIAAGVLITLMATVEGYTRLYLLKHWFTDVLGGYLFGGLLLAVFIYAGRALLDAGDADHADHADDADDGDDGDDADEASDIAGTIGAVGAAPARPDDVMSTHP